YLQFMVTNSSPKLIDRNSIVCMQSPEAYNFGTLLNQFEIANQKRHSFVETCLPLFLYNTGFKLNFYEGSHNNIKILRQEDVAIFTALLKMKTI
ncbi:MAG: 2-C-methyl-D-erythritol 4-phosphate cytidylyltransferase, partial [Bacillales bacterium]|nr:2-C-methyl-D-erythritol 4-phosphate cytidylyltransferase [Bacillales bacterium]